MVGMFDFAVFVIGFAFVWLPGLMLWRLRARWPAVPAYFVLETAGMLLAAGPFLCNVVAFARSTAAMFR